MSENREIQCEYSTTRSNENKCKALEIEFHNCLNILEQKKCPIYKLKQQLKSKEQECEELKDILRKTKEYEEVCTTCKDEILTYPSISGRTDYTDKEVEELTLKQIIDNLQAKEQECEKLKQWKEDAANLFKTQTDNADKIINRYKQTLEEIEEFCTVYSDNHDAYETVYKFILSIINKTKEK